MTKEEIIEEVKKAANELDSWVERAIKDGVYPIIDFKTMSDKQTKTKFTFKVTYKASILTNKKETK